MNIDQILSHLYVTEWISSVVFLALEGRFRNLKRTGHSFSRRSVGYLSGYGGLKVEHADTTSRLIFFRLEGTTASTKHYAECLASSAQLAKNMLDALYDECFPPEKVVEFPR